MPFEQALGDARQGHMDDAYAELARNGVNTCSRPVVTIVRERFVSTEGKHDSEPAVKIVLVWWQFDQMSDDFAVKGPAIV